MTVALRYAMAINRRIVEECSVQIFLRRAGADGSCDNCGARHHILRQNHGERTRIPDFFPYWLEEIVVNVLVS
jgi:hypothetical protein